MISLGGGAFINNLIRKNVKKLTISFWLDTPINELIKRLKKNKKRPLLFRKNIDETIKKIYFESKTGTFFGYFSQLTTPPSIFENCVVRGWVS